MEHRKSTRRIHSREQRPVIPTLIGAGITEQYYFVHLRNINDYKVKTQPRFFGNESIDMLDKKIQQVIKDKGFAICVFDADVTAWNKKEREKLHALQEKYKKSPDVLLCDSLLSIEYWFLLHYETTTRYFGTSAAVMKELKKHLADFSKEEKYLCNETWVKELTSGGKQDKAIQRAIRLGTSGESYSRIHLAIKKLEESKKR